MHDLGDALERQILDLLAHRDAGKTICVSEAARGVFASYRRSTDPDDGWRDLMEPAREAARRLVDAGAVVITQRGEIVDPVLVRGPIRVRRAR